MRKVGYLHMPWVIEQDGLNTTEKMVLTVLTMRANNKTQTTWISLGTICREAGLSTNSRGSARRALEKLRDVGLVTWSERFKDNEQTSHLYTVHWGVGAQNTYPGAEDTYPPVLSTPGVGAESTTDKEPNQEPLTEEENQEEVAWSTPSTARAARPTASDDARGANDPISPAWAASRERKKLLDLIQYAATKSWGPFGEAPHLDDIELELDEAFGGISWSHYIWDRGWIPPRHCANRYNAGAWLNKLLHTVKQEEGPFTWTHDDERQTR